MLTIKAERIIYINNLYIYIFLNRTHRKEDLKSLIALLLHNHYFIVPSFRMYTSEYIYLMT